MLTAAGGNSSDNRVFDPSNKTWERAWGGGGRDEKPYAMQDAFNNSPPFQVSPPRRRRREPLLRRSLQHRHKFDLDRKHSSGKGVANIRPVPLMPPPDSYVRDTDANRYATGAGAGGSPLSDGGRGGRPSPRSSSPRKRPWYPADQYPAGPHPSSGGSRNGNSHIMQPNSQHMSEEGSNGGNAGRRYEVGHCKGDTEVEGSAIHTNTGASSRRSRQSGRVDGEGVAAYGSSRSSPPTTRASQSPDRSRLTTSSSKDKRQERSNENLPREHNNTPEKQPRNALTVARGAVRGLGGRRASSSQNGGVESPPIKITSHVDPSSEDTAHGGGIINWYPGERSDVRGGKSALRIHSENSAGRRSGEPLHEADAKVKGSVTDRRRKPPRQENGARLSAGGNRAEGGDGDPKFRSSAVFLGHSEQVLALARRKDILFSAALDGTAKAWDTYSQQCLATYEGHRKAVWAMQVANRTLITGSADGTVRFWDIETTQSLHVIDLRSAVRDVVIVGAFLAVATSNPGIEVVDLHCMKLLSRLEGHLLAVSAVATLTGEDRLVSGSHDTFLRVWDPATGNCEAVLGGHGGTVGALCTISRPPSLEANDRAKHAGELDGNGGELIISGSGDSTVRVWCRAGGVGGVLEWTCLAVLEGHRHGVWAVHGCSVSGGIFATGGGDATVKIWAPSANDNFDYVTPQERERGQQVQQDQRPQKQLWECVGGVRGVAGAVGTVLMSEQALVLGTSEALIARFPLHLCMPAR